MVMTIIASRENADIGSVCRTAKIGFFCRLEDTDTGQEFLMGSTANILQVDVEDWYMDLDIGSWDQYEDRIVEATSRLLSILEETGNTATFFTLGYVAERFPDLLGKVREHGHEIGSHGYGHKPLQDMSPAEFEEDVMRSKRIIEGLSGERVLGYRAPFFTLTEGTAWALDIIERCGFVYDSSIFPVRTHLYGMPDAPRFPYRISSSNIKKDDPEARLLEFPLSVFVLPGIRRNIPVAGGFYLRLFPYEFLYYAIKRINGADEPAVCYLHPWDLDPGKPVIDGLRWYHYFRLSAAERKLRKMLRDFRFISTREYIEQ
jgi:polysaccharide deacetylase family protein (PEP-CTERM system associated)